MAERGMGKGLKALLGERKSDEGQLRAVPVDLVKPNPRQPRAKLDEAELRQLADSIADHGILQPILVRPLPQGTYELIAGERRWRAAIKAGLGEIPAVLRDGAGGGKADERQSLALALVENMMREDLNPLEEARACLALIDQLGLKQEEVGAKIGRSRAAVSNLIRLLELPDEVQQALADGRLSEGHGRAILQCPEQRRRRVIAREVVKKGLSVRQTEVLAKSSVAGESNRGVAGSKASVQLHPDLEEARRDAEDALSSALGVDVRVRVHGKGAKVEIVVDDIREIQGLAERIAMRCAA